MNPKQLCLSIFLAHPALPYPGGGRHDLHADGALQLLAGGVYHLGQLVVLAGAVALVRHRPLPQARPAAVRHGLAVRHLNQTCRRCLTIFSTMFSTKHSNFFNFQVYYYFLIGF